MSKKRTSLDAIVTRSVIQTQAEEPQVSTAAKRPEAGNRPGFRQQTAYLPLAVHEQLRRLAFEELDLVFRMRGLPGVEELKTKNP
jgi:hypothetical protein